MFPPLGSTSVRFGTNTTPRPRQVPTTRVLRAGGPHPPPFEGEEEGEWEGGDPRTRIEVFLVVGFLGISRGALVATGGSASKVWAKRAPGHVRNERCLKGLFPLPTCL